MAKAINEREIVAAILMEVTENGRYSHIVIRFLEMFCQNINILRKGKEHLSPALRKERWNI